MSEDINKLILAELNKQGLTYKVMHLHQGNSSNNKRNKKKCVTTALIVNEEPTPGMKLKDNIYGRGKSRCSKNDSVDREFGTTLAVIRALVNSFVEHLDK